MQTFWLLLITMLIAIPIALLNAWLGFILAKWRLAKGLSAHWLTWLYVIFALVMIALGMYGQQQGWLSLAYKITLFDIWSLFSMPLIVSDIFIRRSPHLLAKKTS